MRIQDPQWAILNSFSLYGLEGQNFKAWLRAGKKYSSTENGKHSSKNYVDIGELSEEVGNKTLSLLLSPGQRQ